MPTAPYEIGLIRQVEVWILIEIHEIRITNDHLKQNLDTYKLWCMAAEGINLLGSGHSCNYFHYVYKFFDFESGFLPRYQILI